MELEIDQLDLRYEGLRVRSPEKARRLLASLSELGQIVPIVVVAAKQAAERQVVVDGYGRIRALRRLGRDVVRAIQWNLSEVDALLLRRSLSCAGGESSLEQAWLLEELRMRFSMSLEELAKNFDRSPSWVSRRLALVRELPASIQELIRQGKIVPHAAAKHLVPLARANSEHCERLAKNIASSRLSSREIGEIYAAWRDAAVPARERIVEDPELFLQTRKALFEEGCKGQGPRTGLLEDVGALAAICRRACRRIREGAVSAISPVEQGEVRQALSTVQAGMNRLVREFQAAIGGEHARSRNPDGDSRPFEAGTLDPGDRQSSLDLTRCRAGGAPPGDGGGSKDPAGGEGGSLP